MNMTETIATGLPPCAVQTKVFSDGAHFEAGCPIGVYIPGGVSDVQNVLKRI